MDWIEEKMQLRRVMRELLSSKSADARAKESKLASDGLIALILEPLRLKLGRPLKVFCYISFGNELDTSTIINYCWQHGDSVLVPRVASKTELQLHELNLGHELVVNKMGISEPHKQAPVWEKARYHEIDVVIVPGLAYDSHGGRIGYGGGYYDRFMAQLRENVAGVRTQMPVLASVLFKEQLVEHVPIAQHDFRVDRLITDEHMISCDKHNL